MSKTKKPLRKRLTDKQKAFVVEYTTNGGNATQAAKMAGYSPNGSERSCSVSGVQALASTNVQGELARIMAKRELKDEDKQQKLVTFLEETIEQKNTKGMQLKAAELLMKYYGMLKEHRVFEDITRQKELDGAAEQEAETLKEYAQRRFSGPQTAKVGPREPTGGLAGPDGLESFVDDLKTKAEGA